MTRSISAAFRNSTEDEQTSETFVVMATVTHSALLVPIRVNNDIVDYIYNGDTFFGTGFTISLLSDDDQSPKAQVMIPNVDQSVGDALLAISTSPRIRIALLARSDFNDDVPRRAFAIPTVEYLAPELFLRNVTCDAVALTADIFSYDVSTEPWPRVRTTPDLLPGLFR